MIDMNVSLQVMTEVQDEAAKSRGQVAHASITGSEMNKSVCKQNSSTSKDEKDESCTSNISIAVTSAVGSVKKRTNDSCVSEVLYYETFSIILAKFFFSLSCSNITFCCISTVCFIYIAMYF